MYCGVAGMTRDAAVFDPTSRVAFVVSVCHHWQSPASIRILPLIGNDVTGIHP
jgi:hypothetical protein